MLPISVIAAGITTVSPKRRSRVVRSVMATISIVSGPALNPVRHGDGPTSPGRPSGGGNGDLDRRSPCVNRTAVTSE